MGVPKKKKGGGGEEKEVSAHTQTGKNFITLSTSPSDAVSPHITKLWDGASVGPSLKVLAMNDL